MAAVSSDSGSQPMTTTIKHPSSTPIPPPPSTKGDQNASLARTPSIPGADATAVTTPTTPSHTVRTSAPLTRSGSVQLKGKKKAAAPPVNSAEASRSSAPGSTPTRASHNTTALQNTVHKQGEQISDALEDIKLLKSSMSDLARQSTESSLDSDRLNALETGDLLMSVLLTDSNNAMVDGMDDIRQSQIAYSEVIQEIRQDIVEIVHRLPAPPSTEPATSSSHKRPCSDSSQGGDIRMPISAPIPTIIATTSAPAVSSPIPTLLPTPAPAPAMPIPTSTPTSMPASSPAPFLTATGPAHNLPMTYSIMVGPIDLSTWRNLNEAVIAIFPPPHLSLHLCSNIVAHYVVTH
ncbi:hypothetical protein K435DRAFT_851135 [Dendrothele bispora CBS 962.96]|uniref:Uncharacterized protein n=1 Tax=Dendrothele bispora (strain CBS 962.96) TaxID=1314807 RepID=A0A4S8MNM0_DENBC|nr:hypothetical protein K435DRAFT_851135 [Dendrothele bispora CBS 962.96]